MVDQEQLRKANSSDEGSHFHGLTALIFLIFGVILILKLLNFNYAIIGYIPENILYWTAAIGSTFGGLYMIYKKYIYRHKLILR